MLTPVNLEEEDPNYKRIAIVLGMMKKRYFPKNIDFQYQVLNFKKLYDVDGKKLLPTFIPTDNESFNISIECDNYSRGDTKIMWHVENDYFYTVSHYMSPFDENYWKYRNNDIIGYLTTSNEYKNGELEIPHEVELIKSLMFFEKNIHHINTLCLIEQRDKRSSDMNNNTFNLRTVAKLQKYENILPTLRTPKFEAVERLNQLLTHFERCDKISSFKAPLTDFYKSYNSNFEIVFAGFKILRSKTFYKQNGKPHPAMLYLADFYDKADLFGQAESVLSKHIIDRT